MNRDTKDILTVIITTVVILSVCIGGLFIYSGLNSPITVVESNSMQHSQDTSYIGVIDTGDMVIMRDPSETTVTTYIEGSVSGYSKFGEYGDVIIYYRGETYNPVIHRAFLWLEYNADGTWSAPALEQYTGNWTVGTHSENKWENMTGVLSFTNLGFDGSSFATIDLNVLTENYPHSGWLTKGDNNTYFDQTVGIALYGLITEDTLKALAGIEIPWLGCIKLYITDNYQSIAMIPANSIPCLFIAVIDLIVFFIVLMMVLDFLFMFLDERRGKEKNIT